MIEYKLYTETNFEFWGYAGWFFASRHVEKEIGAKWHSDDNMYWILALTNNRCVGISGIENKKNCAFFRNSYVLPEYRKMGVYTNFIKMRFDVAKKWGKTKCTITCTDMSKPIALKLGFMETGKRGHYTSMVCYIQ